ncbi:hypothetical protein IL54_0715 [Sphingobium sp. ba1]|nr:hypothetical protein IL54_0715 [Sphingobium sp. ba1]
MFLLRMSRRYNIREKKRHRHSYQCYRKQRRLMSCSN